MRVLKYGGLLGLFLCFMPGLAHVVFADAIMISRVMMASTIDFPMQSRIIELVDEGNGYLSIYVTNLGHNSPTDSLAHLGREQAAAAIAFPGFHAVSDIDGWWSEDVAGQNLLLRVPLDPDVAARLASETWSQTIESEDTLMSFQAP